MSDMKRFFVVGVQKAGTTTLHDLLAQEHEINLPTIKETHYFCKKQKGKDGISEYECYFESKPTSQVIGEVDPDYAFFPDTPQRILTLFPESKIVFILREPVARARSHYGMSVRRGLEDKSFFEGLAAEEERLKTGGLQSIKHHSYMARGHYVEQLKRYIAAFGQENVKIVLFEDLFGHGINNDLYREICEFIGVANVIGPVAVNMHSNESSGTRLVVVNRLIYTHNPLKKLFRKLIRSDNMKRKIVNFAEKLNKTAKRNDIPRTESRTMVLTVPQQTLEQARTICHELSKYYDIDVSKWKQAIDSYKAG